MPSFGFQKVARIRDYGADYWSGGKGRKLVTRFFWVRMRNGELDFARIGWVVPKRWVNKACDRNYCKRLIREGFRLKSNTLGTQDLLLIVRRQFCKESKQALKDDLVDLWTQVQQYAKISYMVH